MPAPKTTKYTTTNRASEVASAGAAMGETLSAVRISP